MAGRRRRVSSWPTYLLTKIPDADRLALSETARASDTSVADVIRAALCDHYGLACPPQSSHYDGDRDQGATTVLLRLQPKLHSALEREAARTGRSRRRIILETIASHNTEGAA